MRILFLLKKRVGPTGVSYGLFNSCNFVAAALEKNDPTISAQSVSCDNEASIAPHVEEFKPDLCIVEGLWVSPQWMQVLAGRFSQTIWSSRGHSKTPFLASQGSAIAWMLAYAKIARHFKNVTQ